MKIEQSKQGLVPKLRFPEFRDAGEWEMGLLGDYLASHPEYGVNAQAVPFSEYLPTYLRITDISDEGDFISDQKTSVDINVTDRNYLKDGDIVIARTGASVGKSYRYKITDGKLVFAGFLIRIRPNSKKVSSIFIHNFLTSKYYWEWVQINSARSGQPGINGNEFASFPVFIPSILEQQKIASCLSSLDDFIAILKKKLETLKLHKSSLMQKLFPAEGESVPRLRFSEFRDAGEWEVKPLGEIGKFSVGGDVARLDFRKEKDAEHPFPIYANGAGEGIYGYSATYLYNEGCVTVSGRGTLGLANARNAKFCAIVRLIVIMPNESVAPIFLEEMINSTTFAIESTGIPQLTMPKISKYRIAFPFLSEQQKIADCLSSINKLIKAQNQKIEALKIYKKGILQQLFPAPKEGER